MENGVNSFWLYRSANIMGIGPWDCLLTCAKLRFFCQGWICSKAHKMSNMERICTLLNKFHDICSLDLFCVWMEILTFPWQQKKRHQITEIISNYCQGSLKIKKEISLTKCQRD